MIVEIVFENDEAATLTVEQDLLLQAMRVAANRHKVPDNCEVVITITDNEQIRELNRDYRNIDLATDVLSFAYDEAEEPEIIGGATERILGDVIISIDKVREQALIYNHSVARELSYLAVHGFLHLLGFDHLTAADKKIMRLQEEAIMQDLELERATGGI
ncbi:MAG: rRNA maturation RNase YbeY [Bacillota bacterium]